MVNELIVWNVFKLIQLESRLVHEANPHAGFQAVHFHLDPSQYICLHLVVCEAKSLHRVRFSFRCNPIHNLNSFPTSDDQLPFQLS
jgi:hypothetical protein